jgi:adenylate cyclase class 2
MALEIEAKIKVDSCAGARARLGELGARRVYDVLETNELYDTSDQQLFRRGCGLRIRTCRGEGDVPRPALTHKGPQQAGLLKSRDEIETEVTDPTALGDILKSLGYVPVIIFEKRREEWELDGLKIELDEVPRLGSYVEIEGPDEASVRALQARLGLGGHPSIQDSYVALLIDHARRNDLPWDVIRFST